MKISGIVLAGGKSSRLGFNKLEIKVGNIPLFIDIAVKLSYFCSEILLSTSAENSQDIKDELKNFDMYLKEYNPLKLNIPEARVIPDIDTDKINNACKNKEKNLAIEYSGALKGIYSSLL